jgi:acetoin utilization protein AcuB
VKHVDGAAVQGKRSRRERQLTIGDVMTPQPLTIARDQTLEIAHVMMREHRLHHLPVLEHGRLVGVLSLRDLYFVETIAGVDVEHDSIDDAMNADAYQVGPETPLQEVARAMAERGIGSAVVTERERVIGIFTASDALRLLGGRGPVGVPAPRL